MNYKIINGNSAEVLKQYPDNYFDSVVTDPPYGINFLGKDWDSNVGEEEVYRQCYRVLKPGGHILAFSAARTYHHLAMAVERCGFEIRDQIMWIYGSGFPKSQDIGRQLDKAAGKKDPNYGSKKTANQGNETVALFSNGVRCGKCNRTFNADIIKECPESPCGMKYNYQTSAGKQWSGWGTQLKPAHEPIVMARKPISEKNIADNCIKWGTGAINVDGCRVPLGDNEDLEQFKAQWDRTAGGAGEYSKLAGKKEYGSEPGGNDISAYAKDGRFPANIIHDNSDEVVSMFPNSNGAGGSVPDTKVSGYGSFAGGTSTYTPNNRTKVDSGSGSAARFFYSAKVSRKERHMGLEAPPPIENYNMANIKEHPLWDPSIGTNVQRLKHKIMEHEKSTGKAHDVSSNVGNNHPTVKPVELMKYLIKLVTPKNGRVLDPFNGSGSTGMAAVELGHEYVGIELDPKYCEIAKRRIEAWHDKTRPFANELFTMES